MQYALAISQIHTISTNDRQFNDYEAINITQKLQDACSEVCYIHFALRWFSNMQCRHTLMKQIWHVYVHTFIFLPHIS